MTELKKKRRRGRIVAGKRYEYCVRDRLTCYTIHRPCNAHMTDGRLLGMAVDLEDAIRLMREQQAWGN
jgi:hypothetical protein